VRMRAVVIATLAVIVCMSAGALVSAEDVVLTIANRSNIDLKVRIYRHDDPVQWIACAAYWLDPGQEVRVPDNPWPGCGHYQKFLIKAVYEILPGDGEELVYERGDVERGSHVDIYRMW